MAQRFNRRLRHRRTVLGRCQRRLHRRFRFGWQKHQNRRQQDENAQSTAAPRVCHRRVGRLRVLDGLGNQIGGTLSQIPRGPVLFFINHRSSPDGFASRASPTTTRERESVQGRQLFRVVFPHAARAVLHVRVSRELRARRRRPHVQSQLHLGAFRMQIVV